MEKENQFHKVLKGLMDEFVNKVYDYSVNFPPEERYGLISQIRRAALSIVLNYIEGYARQSKNSLKYFLDISYGSLKECKYLIYFSFKRNYLNENQYNELVKLADRIGAMLWGIISKIKA